MEDSMKRMNLLGLMFHFCNMSVFGTRTGREAHPDPDPALQYYNKGVQNYRSGQYRYLGLSYLAGAERVVGLFLQFLSNLMFDF